MPPEATLRYVFLLSFVKQSLLVFFQSFYLVFTPQNHLRCSFKIRQQTFWIILYKVGPEILPWGTPFDFCFILKSCLNKNSKSCCDISPFQLLPRLSFFLVQNFCHIHYKELLMYKNTSYNKYVHKQITGHYVFWLSLYKQKLGSFF